MSRIDELRAEESSLVKLIEGTLEVDIVGINDEKERLQHLFDADIGSAKKAKLPSSDPTTQPEIEELDMEASDAMLSALHHSISDDSNRSGFEKRIEEFLNCDKFTGWRKSRAFFLNLTLVEQTRHQLPCRDEIVELLNGSYLIPKCLWDELFDYQRKGVEWMLSLHLQNRGGGILGDEMGLGKTVQVIAYLAALHISGQLDEPGLIIVPSTLLRQWIRELHTWWPPLRTILLHGTSPPFQEARSHGRYASAFRDTAHVYITSYGTISSPDLQRFFHSPRPWSFAILDEGHKIRNPDAQISILCKTILCTNRLILSGTPIQNNLTELWSLFDFVCPGRLGILPVFKEELANPINAGGYANASLFQAQTSYKCACVLRDLIKPYLLRRTKKQVFNTGTGPQSASLPEKREEIVFCRITDYQKALYERFLQSDEVEAIVERRRNVLAGIDVLRKLCNHPDLLEVYYSDERQEELFDNNVMDEDEEMSQNLDTSMIKQIKSTFTHIVRPNSVQARAGKLAVLEKILSLWHRQGHRALVFCQTRQMLNLLEEFLGQLSERYGYLRMDGTTPIRQRLELVDKFNAPSSTYFLFLLTTRVGGLGINLTGADRVIIYDPDWNPSTDMQARERVYRLGQQRPVRILRLLTAGTIEEKIYHRQLFKQLLQQRVLDDPNQTRFFRAADLYDLFTLSDPNDSAETTDLFAGLEDAIDKELSREKSGRLAAEKGEVGQDVILEDLLNVAGVHSTLQTTPISDQSRPEYALVEMEAEKIAQHALEALKAQQVAAPTAAPMNKWAGRFGAQVRVNEASGEEAAMDAVEVNAPSASDILTAIAARTRPGTTVSALKSTTLAVGIVDYFNRVDIKNFGLDSDQVAKAFNRHIQIAQEAVLFRTLLKKVAVFEKSKRRWHLRPEFRAASSAKK